MAFGTHWEWRGFGELPVDVRAAIEALPEKFPDAQELTDEYLWTPDCSVNVKLRLGDLKLKRLVDSRDAGGDLPALERWLEDRNENWAFPLSGSRLRAVEEAVRIDAGSLGAGPCDREELLALLGDRARVVAVGKSRRQFSLPLAGASQDAATVELAEILSPERLTSVGLEHSDAAGVDRAYTELGLHGRLLSLSYLDALGRWARGERLPG